MVPTKQTIGLYMYTLGVLFSGSFLVEQMGGFDSVLLWIALFVAAGLWVVYYTLVMVPRFEYFADGDDENDPERSRPPEL